MAGNGSGTLLIRPTVVLFGDSLTQRSMSPAGGWAAALASAYCRKIDVVLRGYGGYNSRWALHMLEQIFPAGCAPLPSLVTVWFGANDAALPDHISARQHVPVDEYASNIGRIIQHLQQLGVQCIMLITPPPVAEEARVRHNQQKQGRVTAENSTAERTTEHTGLYAAALRRLARPGSVEVCDLWTPMQQEPDWQGRLLEDGLHFTPAGQQWVAGQVQAALDAKFPRFRYDSMPHDFPHHEDVNPTDPATSLKRGLAA